MSNKIIIAVDFDGTLCEDNYPNIGNPIQTTINFIKKQKNAGNTIILWTCRQGEYLAAAVDWSKSQGIVFDYINENTTQNVAKYGNNPRKVFADIYIDDKAVQPTINQLINTMLGLIKEKRQNGGKKQ